MILVSACLLGCACRYDGQSKPNPLAQELAKRGLAVPVCPEQLGGLPTPRKPSERRGDRVVMSDGRGHGGADEGKRHKSVRRERIGEAAVSRLSHFIFRQRRTNFEFTFGRKAGII